MTTGDPTPPDFDFDAIINGSGVLFELKIDKGVVDFEVNRVEVQREVNESGGIMSPYYEPIYNRLNELWEFHEHTVLVNGRVYPKSNNPLILKYIEDELGDPEEDEHGKYWVCDDVELQSFGIIDVAREANDTQDADFVYGFGFEGDELPCLFVRYGLASLEYNTITDAQVAAWFKEKYPDLFEEVNQIIDIEPHDYTASIRRLQNMVTQIQQELAESDELGGFLSRYVSMLLKFSKELPVVVEFVPGAIFELQDDDASWVKVDFSEGSTEVVVTPDLDISQNRAGVVVGFPEASGGTARIGYIPLETIHRMYATTPEISVLDRAVKGMPQDTSGDFDDLGNGEAVLAPVEVPEGSAQRLLDTLTLAQDGLSEVYAMAVNHAKFAKYESAEEAFEQGIQIANQMMERLVQTDAISRPIDASGSLVTLPSEVELQGTFLENNLQFTRHKGPRPLGQYESTTVMFGDIFVRPVKLTEDPDTYAAAFFIRGVSEMTVVRPDAETAVPDLDIIVKELVTIPLDGTSEISVRLLARTKEILGQIDALGIDAEGGTIIKDVRIVYDALIDAEGTETLPTDAMLRLYGIAKYIETSENDKVKDRLLYALRLIFAQSESDFSVAQSEKEIKLYAGTIIDVAYSGNGSKLSISLQDENGELHVIPLASIKGFRVS